MNRRAFIKTTSLSLLSSSVYLPACDKHAGIPIIDTHQHLWDLEQLPLTWVKPPLDKSFVMKDYLKAVKGQQVVKAIYMEVGAPPEYKEREAKMALELCKNPDNPTVGVVISADPTDPEFKSYIENLAESPYLKGIRIPIRDVEQLLLQRTLDNLRMMGRLGLSTDLNLNPQLLSIGNQLLDACPETRFILNHCGNADPFAFFQKGKTAPREPRHEKDQWYQDMEMMAQRDNIICKISGIVDNAGDHPLTASDLSPIINHCFNVFGPDRVIFASDWPVCLRNMSLARWIETLKQVSADRSITEQRKLFYDNANRFYGLED